MGTRRADRAIAAQFDVRLNRLPEARELARALALPLEHARIVGFSPASTVDAQQEFSAAPSSPDRHDIDSSVSANDRARTAPP
jgi:hypothetical protein